MKTEAERDRNEDPLTGEPGAHPVGVGLGTASGATAGAALGAIGGPVGAALGAVAGGVIGGYIGKGAAEAINPTVEDAYWRENHAQQPWASADTSYDDDYAPAYRLGYEGRARYGDSRWEDREPDLEREWDQVKGGSRLRWEQAKAATSAGWHRIEERLPGDADGDGR